MATLVGKSNSTLSSSSSLKRKRPPSLDIPNVLREIPATAGDSDRRRISAVVDDHVAGIGVFSRQGKKRFMEDAHRIVSFSPSDSNGIFFGVYDGHGGKMAAEFASENLHKNVIEMMKNCAEIEEAVRAGYLKTDQDFLNQGLRSGTCCVTAVIEGPRIAVSNVGDCRAVLCRDGVAEPLTRDHRADDKDEQERIEKKGGYVEIHRGAWRVHGVLAVSRSIGDAHLKDWVLAEPETKVLSLTPDMEFLVLASDGLWEQVGNQEVVDTVKRFRLPQKNSESSSGQCLKLNDGCVNMSPLPKLRRVSLAKKTSLNNTHTESENESPGLSKLCMSLVKRVNTKTEEESSMKENFEVPISNSVRLVGESPRPSKQRQVSLVERANTKTVEESPKKENNGVPINNSMGLVDESPRSLKQRRVSLVKRVNKKTEEESPMKENIRVPINNSVGLFDESSRPSKQRRLSLVKRVNTETEEESLMKENIGVSNNSEGLVDESPRPSKLRRVSLFKRVNTEIEEESSTKENIGSHNNNSNSEGLVVACKELADLAVKRGGLDDITVMVIDLKHYFKLDN